MLLENWGFKYRTILLVCCKQTKNWLPTVGLGYWTLSSVEFLVMGTKGNIKDFKGSNMNV